MRGRAAFTADRIRSSYTHGRSKLLLGSWLLNGRHWHWLTRRTPTLPAHIQPTDSNSRAGVPEGRIGSREYTPADRVLVAALPEPGTSRPFGFRPLARTADSSGGSFAPAERGTPARAFARAPAIEGDHIGAPARGGPLRCPHVAANSPKGRCPSRRSRVKASPGASAALDLCYPRSRRRAGVQHAAPQRPKVLKNLPL
jgi:hypothetical protein